jgi:putative zinc finger/helix-turn-helix YgiT family protein
MRKCPVCETRMTSKIENYKYTASGLSNVVLRSVAVHRCPNCGEHEVEIPRLLQLHEAIGTALAMKRPALVPNEIRFLRKSLGFSGSEFAREMGVEPETVSRWEHGALAMGLSAERLLRLMVLSRGTSRHFQLATLGIVKGKMRITATNKKGPWVAAAA